MAESTVRQFLFSALIFTAVLTAAFILIGSFLPSGDGGFSEYNTSAYQKFDDLQTEQEGITNRIKSADPGGTDILGGLIGASWGSLKLVWNSASIMTIILSDISSTFGVPVWFTGLAISIILITIAFALMAAWFKWHI